MYGHNIYLFHVLYMEIILQGTDIYFILVLGDNATVA